MGKEDLAAVIALALFAAIILIWAVLLHGPAF